MCTRRISRHPLCHRSALRAPHSTVTFERRLITRARAAQSGPAGRRRRRPPIPAAPGLLAVFSQRLRTRPDVPLTAAPHGVGCEVTRDDPGGGGGALSRRSSGRSSRYWIVYLAVPSRGAPSLGGRGDHLGSPRWRVGRPIRLLAGGRRRLRDFGRPRRLQPGRAAPAGSWGRRVVGPTPYASRSGLSRGVEVDRVSVCVPSGRALVGSPPGRLRLCVRPL